MKEKYKCSYCGAEYDTALDRAKCELECDEKRKQEAEEQRKNELREAKDARRQELIQKRRELEELTKKYYEDYGMTSMDLWDAFFEQEFPMMIFGRH